MAKERLTAANRSIEGYYPEYQGRPVDFCSEVLGLELWHCDDEHDSQRDIVQAVGEYETVAVRSGHKVGKSTCAAALALWWYSCYPTARAVFTAPTHRQVKIVVWREVRRLVRQSKKPLTVPSAGVPRAPDTGLQADDGRELIGFTTDDPDKFSGISGQHVMYIVDEAPGVAEDIFEALEGNRAGGAKLIMFGNPTRTSGKFFDAFHTERRHWKLFHIHSGATPDDPPIPGLATRAWAEERLDAWGDDSPIYAVRVAGDFPMQSENAVITLALLEASLAAHHGLNGQHDKDELRLGVDCARFGDDDSVIYPVRGYKAFEPTVLHGLDTVQLAGAVMEVLRSMGGNKNTVVTVDGTGLGAGVVDQLNSAHKKDCRVYSAETGRRSDDPTLYNNLRTQMHFALRDWMMEGGAIYPDEILEGELVAPVYSFDSQGRYVVESKDAIKSRIKHSPDRMDALSLAVYRPPLPKKARLDPIDDKLLPNIRM